MAFAICAATFGRSHLPDLNVVIRHLRAGLNPEEAMSIMRQVYANDRYFTFPRFQHTADYLKREMNRLGLKHVEISEILDDSLPEEERTLADYPKIPSSLGMWSGPTPPE